MSAPHVPASTPPARRRDGSTSPEPEVRGQSADTELATNVTSYLLAGPLCFGGIGYGLDRWLGTTGVVAVGVLIGMALSLYVIWLRYGGGAGSNTHGAPDAAPETGKSTATRPAHATNATNEESQ